MKTARPRLFTPAMWSGVLVATFVLALLPALNLAFDPGHPLHVSSYVVSLLAKFMCYAIAALALDLVWGYTGILSLGHGLFFALGGYAHGMYLMRAIGRDGVSKSDLPDFMVFLDWKEYPGTGVLAITLPGRCCWSCWCRGCWLSCLDFLLFARASRAFIFPSLRKP